VASVLGAQVAHAQAIQNVVLRNSFNPTGGRAPGWAWRAFIAVADDGTAAPSTRRAWPQLRRTEFAAVGFPTGSTPP